VSKNPVTFTISLLQLCFAVGLQVLVVAVSVGGLFSRVEAMEAAVAPLSRGDIVRLDERVQHMQGDIAWIRAQLEKDRER
jgi:hypothetical protein